ILVKDAKGSPAIGKKVQVWNSLDSLVLEAVTDSLGIVSSTVTVEDISPEKQVNGNPFRVKTDGKNRQFFINGSHQLILSPGKRKK
ncbi:MAG TPA: hypothetical protein VL943_13420, partial [Niabella sp.]|nr:hypothetical protein [Niabella sp.]